MRILVTGAAGFIGRHLVERLAGDHQVFAVQRQFPAQLRAGVTYVEQDLARPLDVQRLPARLDAIIHQAATIHTDRVDDATPFLVNVVATWRLLEYGRSAGIHTFVHASTGGIYGCSDEPLQEDRCANPMDLYSLTKTQGELAVAAAAGDFHKIVLRYFFPYGVGTPNPMPRHIRMGLTGEPVRVRADGGPHLNPLHVSDAVEATILALAIGDSLVVNVAGEEVTSFGEIAAFAAHSIGREANLVIVPDGEMIPYYRADVVGDISRLKDRLGFRPRITLANGLPELVENETQALP